jgi:hypothetical protein
LADAAGKGQLGVVKTLVKQGANVNLPTGQVCNDHALTR